MSELESLSHKLSILERHIKERFDRERRIKKGTQDDHRTHEEPVVIIEKPKTISGIGIISWIVKNIFRLKLQR